MNLRLDEVLARGTVRLESFGGIEARRCAEILLAKVLNMGAADLLSRNREPVSEEIRIRYEGLVDRRRDGEPIAYLTGDKEFYSTLFSVDSRVLIPRPETEFLIDAIRSVVEMEKMKAPRICDVGTGSGAVAVTLKLQIPDANILALDISDKALDVAQTNARRNSASVRFLKSDLLDGINEQFDVIAANLPYVASEEWDQLASDVRMFEPRSALDGGAGGLETIARLIPQAFDRLNSGGYLLLEFGAGQKERLSALLETRRFMITRIWNDYAGIPRVVSARRGEHGA